MRIRGKLICSFLIIILLPTILLLCTAMGLYQYQMQAVMNLDSDITGVEAVLSNPIQFMNGMTEDLFYELEDQAKKNADCLLDQNVLEQYNRALKWKYSFLVVKKEEEFIYIGDDTCFEGMEERIPSEKDISKLNQNGIYVSGENAFLLKESAVSFQDGQRGCFYIITMVDGWLPVMKRVIMQLVFSFVIIMIVTAIILIAWIYGGILRPLNALKRATHHMRDGDLDYQVGVTSEDEVGMLCRDFEEMRVRLKESTEMRLQYEQQMRELISNISHDLKTPLTAIEGYTEGILDGVASTPEKQQKYLQTIHAKAKQMTLLVDELSTSAKIENGIVPYNFQVINVDSYFRDCIEELKVDLGLQQIEVSYENQADVQVRVEMDPEQLKRVINNIVSNSVKYMKEEPGKLFICVVDEEKLAEDKEFEAEEKREKREKKEKKRKEKEKQEELELVVGEEVPEKLSGRTAEYMAYQENTEQLEKEIKEKNKKRKRAKENNMKKEDAFVRVEFRDTGKGISSQALPHIFERSYRADASRRSATGGSGLGLAIAAKIIEDHGGSIWAESVEGQGTSIFFTLRKEERSTYE